MPEVGPIRKLLFWRTKSPFTDRWDVEITYEDKRKERRLSVTSASAAALVKAAIERTESEGKKVKPCVRIRGTCTKFRRFSRRKRTAFP